MDTESSAAANASQITEPSQLQFPLGSHSSHARFTLDATGQVLTWNRNAETMFGYPRVAAVGKFFYHFLALDNEQVGLLEQELIAAYHEGHTAARHRYRRQDGTYFWSLGTVAAIWRNNSFAGYEVTIKRAAIDLAGQ